MATETPATPQPAAALAGLDKLDAAPPAQAKSRFWAKAWAASWPKLLALVLALAIWQLVYLSGFKHDVLPGPAATFQDLWGQLHHALLWQAHRHHTAPRGDRLRAGPGHRHRGRRAGVPDQAAAGRGRIADHRTADAALDRLGPVRHHPVRGQLQRDPVRHRDDRGAGRSPTA